MSIVRRGIDVSTLSDAELVKRVRSGDTQAYGVLWERHSRAGATVARSYTSSFDPDDLVSESYAKIFQIITAGGGPDGAFRPYLFTTIRNTAASWGRARRETSMDDAEQIEDPAFSEENSLAALDRSLTASAFRALPTRWQEALWYSEVEGMTPQEIAPLLGMKANSVAALTYRAREGLRQAWIQAHLKSVPDDSDCRWTIDRLGGYARKSLGKRDTGRLEAHLQDCAKCTIVAAEAKDVGSRLALVLLPLTAGVAGAAGYTAWMQSGAHTATYALGAGGVIMPAAAFGSGQGAAGSSAGGSASGSAGGGGGVLVGASIAAALVIAAVVAAAALGPALFGGPETPARSAARSSPSAAPSSGAPSSTTPAPSAAPAAPPVTAPASSAAGPAPTGRPAASIAAPVPVVPAAPALTTANVSGDGALDARGTAHPGNTVTVAASPDATTAARGFARSVVLPSSVTLGTATASADGSWRVSADMSSLPDGGYTLFVTQTTPAGVTGAPVTRSVRVRITVAAPVFVSPVNGSTLSTMPTAFSGTVAHADAVLVSVDGGAVRTATLHGSLWRLPVAALGNGVHRANAVVRYKHRSSATARAAFTLAVPPSITTPTAGAPITSPQLSIAGMGSPGARIDLGVADWTPPVGSATPEASTMVATDGRWAAILDLSALPNGDYTLTTTQTDASGGVSRARSVGLSLRVALARPVIDAVDVGPLDASGAGLYFPIVSGSSAPNATIVVSDGTGSSIRVTAGDDGQWQTPQLTGYGAGAGVVSAYRTDGYVDSARTQPLSIAIAAAPRVTVTQQGDWSAQPHRFTVGYSGRPDARFMPYADGVAWASLGSQSLDDNGAFADPTIWYWQNGSDDHTLGARYESGDRFGPTLNLPFLSVAGSASTLRLSLRAAAEPLAVPTTR